MKSGTEVMAMAAAADLGVSRRKMRRPKFYDTVRPEVRAAWGQKPGSLKKFGEYVPVV